VTSRLGTRSGAVPGRSRSPTSPRRPAARCPSRAVHAAVPAACPACGGVSLWRSGGSRASLGRLDVPTRTHARGKPAVGPLGWAGSSFAGAL